MRNVSKVFATIFFSRLGNTDDKNQTQGSSSGNSLFFYIVIMNIHAFIIMGHEKVNTISIKARVPFSEPGVYLRFQISIARKPLRSKPYFQQREQVVIRQGQIGTIQQICENNPAKTGKESEVDSGGVGPGIGMKNNDSGREKPWTFAFSCLTKVAQCLKVVLPFSHCVTFLPGDKQIFGVNQALMVPKNGTHKPLLRFLQFHFFGAGSSACFHTIVMPHCW